MLDLLVRILHPQANTGYGPAEDYLYTDRAGLSMSGQNVDEESAQKISAFYRGVEIIAGTIAGLPLDVFAFRAGGSREKARTHPLYEVLHRLPNVRDTSYDWRYMLVRNVIYRGNHYSYIQPGPRGFADQLVPLNPERMKAELLDSGRKRYQYKTKDNQPRTFAQEEILHVHGPLGRDGVTGMSVLAFARESLGEQLAGQTYASRSLANGVRPGMILKHPAVLGEEAGKHLREQFDKSNAGPMNANKTLLLEEGMEATPMGFTNVDAQFLEGRHFGVADIGRWLGVPLVLLQETEKSTSWGTGIEQINLGFVIYTIRSWLTMIEQRMNADLILEPDHFFIEFNLDGLLRGDAKTRGDLYAQGRQWGWWSVNDVRRKENENPIGPKGDIYLQPSNMTAAGDFSQVGVQPQRAASAQERFLAVREASRLVRKETQAALKAAKRFAGDGDGWQEWVEGFYAGHAVELAESLNLSLESARDYASEQRDQLLGGGVGVIEGWMAERPAALVEMMLAGSRGRRVRKTLERDTHERIMAVIEEEF